MRKEDLDGKTVFAGRKEGDEMMSVSSIGSSDTYIYNIRTGRLSKKDGSADNFVDYFNGDTNGRLPDTLNGFDAKRKRDINDMIMLFQSGPGNIKGLFQEQNGDEYEITSEIVDAVTTHFSVNGEKVFTSYDMNVFTYMDHVNADDLLYKTRNSKAYEPSDNSINIAVNDTFDLGNGYSLKVKENSIWIDGLGSGSEEQDKKAKQLAYGLDALIRFAGQQWISDRIDRESTPMLLCLLRELGVDTDKQFQINGTKCEVRHGRIKEAGNRFAVPSSIFKEAMRKYEDALYMPLS